MLQPKSVRYFKRVKVTIGEGTVFGCFADMVFDGLFIFIITCIFILNLTQNHLNIARLQGSKNK